MLDEFFEIMTWAKLRFHEKPCGVLNISGYYDRLLDLIDHIVEAGFLEDVYHRMIIIERSPKMLLEKFQQYQAPAVKPSIVSESSDIL